jgi:hypothetical protein
VGSHRHRKGIFWRTLEVSLDIAGSGQLDEQRYHLLSSAWPQKISSTSKKLQSVKCQEMKSALRLSRIPHTSKMPKRQRGQQEYNSPPEMVGDATKRVRFGSEDIGESGGQECAANYLVAVPRNIHI